MRGSEGYSSLLHGSCTRLGLTVASLSEGHEERMESGGLGKHLRQILLKDLESKIGSSLMTNTL